MSDAPRKPRDDEIDISGLTHTGKVRTENQDHFFAGTLHKRLRVLDTSLPYDALPERDQRIAALALVADGVGGQAAGETASRLTVEEVAGYISHTLHCYYTSDSHHEELFVDKLVDAVLHSHARVLEDAVHHPERDGMATTLTLVMTVWPRAYVVQVGDSRCYRLREGKLEQLTTDQTVAQTMVDMGVMDPQKRDTSKWSKILASAIGGPDAIPALGVTDLAWGDVLLLCSDGLNKHVTDDRIASILAGASNSEEACHNLVDAALDGGGTDNITVVVGRLPDPA